MIIFEMQNFYKKKRGSCPPFPYCYFSAFSTSILRCLCSVAFTPQSQVIFLYNVLTSCLPKTAYILKLLSLKLLLCEIFLLEIKLIYFLNMLLSLRNLLQRNPVLTIARRPSVVIKLHCNYCHRQSIRRLPLLMQ